MIFKRKNKPREVPDLLFRAINRLEVLSLIRLNSLPLDRLTEGESYKMDFQVDGGWESSPGFVDTFYRIFGRPIVSYKPADEKKQNFEFLHGAGFYQVKKSLTDEVTLVSLPRRNGKYVLEEDKGYANIY